MNLNVRYFAPALLAAALVVICCSAVAEPAGYLIMNRGDGTYAVQDERTGRIYITRNPQALASSLYGNRHPEGFGGKLSQSKFQAPPATPSQQVVATANRVMKPAFQDVNRVPLGRQITQPIQRLFNAFTRPRTTQ